MAFTSPAACDDSFLKDALPFFASIGMTLVGPFLDDLLWRSRYRSFYSSAHTGLVDDEQLARGASWAVDLAQVFSGVVLTWVGIVLLLDSVTPVYAGLWSLTPVAPLLLISWIQRRGNLHLREKDPHWGPYALPHLALVVVNALGIAVAYLA